MEYIEDWVERALSCFTRERDKQTQPGSANSNENDPDFIFKIDDENLKEQFERLVVSHWFPAYFFQSVYF